eukprot:TRINITY_DN21939_c0_g1_i1.p1 TRINITY_DN21939_c0_g1~~TRINITY_DN21939_c0_g1_i1.p1  ORF type:complete len:629 (+),score=4.68 TRINITY_DN21939_c0_g1_i1:74-1960(+)
MAGPAGGPIPKWLGRPSTRRRRAAAQHPRLVPAAAPQPAPSLPDTISWTRTPGEPLGLGLDPRLRLHAVDPNSAAGKQGVEWYVNRTVTHAGPPGALREVHSPAEISKVCAPLSEVVMRFAGPDLPPPPEPQDQPTRASRHFRASSSGRTRSSLGSSSNRLKAHPAAPAPPPIPTGPSQLAPCGAALGGSCDAADSARAGAQRPRAAARGGYAAPPAASAAAPVGRVSPTGFVDTASPPASGGADGQVVGLRLRNPVSPPAAVPPQPRPSPPPQRAVSGRCEAAPPPREMTVWGVDPGSSSSSSRRSSSDGCATAPPRANTYCRPPPGAERPGPRRSPSGSEDSACSRSSSLSSSGVHSVQDREQILERARMLQCGYDAPEAPPPPAVPQPPLAGSRSRQKATVKNLTFASCGASWTAGATRRSSGRRPGTARSALRQSGHTAAPRNPLLCEEERFHLERERRAAIEKEDYRLAKDLTLRLQQLSTVRAASPRAAGKKRQPHASASGERLDAILALAHSSLGHRSAGVVAPQWRMRVAATDAVWDWEDRAVQRSPSRSGGESPHGSPIVSGTARRARISVQVPAARPAYTDTVYHPRSPHAALGSDRGFVAEPPAVPIAHWSVPLSSS